MDWHINCVLLWEKANHSWPYLLLSFSDTSLNQMRTVKNSNDLLEISFRSQCVCNSIKTFGFSILYTIIPHEHLKYRNKALIRLYFSKKNKCISILLYIEKSLTLSKVIQDIIININRT